MSRILLVEDDADQCLLLANYLCDEGFDIAIACDGVKALQILSEADPLPDVILLDLYMPNMNGWQLKEVLAKDPRYSKIPIVIMSGDKAATAVEADAHVLKPFDISVIPGIIAALRS